MSDVYNTTHIFFLDETGDHGLNFIDENFPIFLLAGCLFEMSEYGKLSREIQALKQEFFGTDQVILHSRDIRKCEGVCKIFFDSESKARFYSRLNRIINNAKFTLISVAIDKKKYINNQGITSANPYVICLSHILERLIYITDKNLSTSTISVQIEKRGLVEDRLLMNHYKEIINHGTSYVHPSRFKQRIRDFIMLAKKDNCIGLQIADLCAYPLARHILNPLETYIPFEIIQHKLSTDGLSLKIFP